jgi:hypothetical protein
MQTDSFPGIGIVKEYYVHEEPERLDRTEFVNWVAANQASRCMHLFCNTSLRNGPLLPQDIIVRLAL